MNDIPPHEKPLYWNEKLDVAFPFLLWNDTWNYIGSVYPAHYQKSFEMFAVLKGKVDVYMNGKVYTLSDRDILFINRELIHGYSNQSHDTHYIVFLFGAEIFDQSMVDLMDGINIISIFNKRNFFQFGIDKEIHARLENDIMLLDDEFRTMKDGYKLAIRKYLYDIALLFIRELPPSDMHSQKRGIEISHHTILERVFSYIYYNYKDPCITLEQVADIAAMSKFYFCRFFRERTGMTFHAYLSKLKVNKAKELLNKTDMPIIDIAYESGFSSLKTFNRLFKDYVNISPSLYRSGLKNISE